MTQDRNQTVETVRSVGRPPTPDRIYHPVSYLAYSWPAASRLLVELFPGVDQTYARKLRRIKTAPLVNIRNTQNFRFLREHTGHQSHLLLTRDESKNRCEFEWSRLGFLF